MKQTFELTITNQKRVITALLLFPFVFFGVLVISSKFNPGIGFLSFLTSMLLLWYFVIGKLIVSIENEKINFQWKKKVIFNYNNIQSLNESDIEKVIIDKGQFLRKIITKDRIINLSTSKLKPIDSYKLISYFNQRSKTQNIEIKNSWETINPKTLKILYAITWIIIVISILILIVVCVLKGFKPKMLFVIGAIPILLVYAQQIERAIKKKTATATNRR